jgi:hypothetical protein
MTTFQPSQRAAPLPPYLAAFFASRPVQPAPRGSGFVPPRGVSVRPADIGTR